MPTTTSLEQNCHGMLLDGIKTERRMNLTELCAMEFVPFEAAAFGFRLGGGGSVAGA
ncbi:hypothetical protein FH972_010597 [Carpinus fangiana]|uniref:Uncharacterized protein n=1 Tax=Carpinus fangiana TaxID=176857 RepID=A0A660KQN5_9ROSI|nr:hypothetical protein FH972_010597 [Carpinus fangiana]